MVGQGENSCTISKDFLVMDDDKPWILLGTPWLDWAGWEPIVKREFKLMHKDKVITIPLLVHKSSSFFINSKRENLGNKSILASSDLSQEGGPEINLTLEKKNFKLWGTWNMLFDTFNTKEILIDVCEKFLLFYDKLDCLLS